MFATVFAYSTRGGKYAIHLQITGTSDPFPGTYQIVETANGQLTGFANLGSASYEKALSEFNSRIADSAKYDGIFYTKNLRPIGGSL